MSGAVDVAARIALAGNSLTTAERRVAEVVLARPQLVAFGTVAELADAAGAGAATVVRFATKLSLEGFSGLQAEVQEQLAQQLRPAAERIRESASSEALGAHQRLVVENVRSSLAAVDPDALRDAVERLASAPEVHVLSGDASAGVALQFGRDLGSLRDAVRQVEGNPVAVQRQVALMDAHAAVVCLDLRRYDRWVVEAVATLRGRGVWMLAVTDSVLSPLSAHADNTFVVAAGNSGPFDSHVAMLAVLDLLVIGVADRLRTEAADRLDRAEAAWRKGNELVDR